MTVIGTSSITITVNVGISSDTTTHNWAGGTSANAIQSGGSYNHIFVSATAGAVKTCLLYTSPSPRDVEEARMPSSA